MAATLDPTALDARSQSWQKALMILNNFYSRHFSSICSLNRARDRFSFTICAYGGHFGKWLLWPPGVKSMMAQYPNLLIIHHSTFVPNLVLLSKIAQQISLPAPLNINLISQFLCDEVFFSLTYVYTSSSCFLCYQQKSLFVYPVGSQTESFATFPSH